MNLVSVPDGDTATFQVDKYQFTMRWPALTEEFQENLAMHNHRATWSGCLCRAGCWKGMFDLPGAVQQLRNAGFQGSRNAFDIVQTDIVFRTFNGAYVTAIQAAEFGEHFL